MTCGSPVAANENVAGAGGACAPTVFAGMTLAARTLTALLALLSLAMDYTPVHGAPPPENAHELPPVPPDSICDFALDALRRQRKGEFAPRLFSWNASAGEYPSYAAALAVFRMQELDESLDWWARRRPRETR